MNRFRKKYKVLVFAFFLTLVHAFIPHVHSNANAPLVIDATQSCDDFIHVFTKALTFNLGQHHLENFKDADFVVDIDQVPGIIELPVPTQETVDAPPFSLTHRAVILPHIPWFKSVHITRGSPFIS